MRIKNEKHSCIRGKKSQSKNRLIIENKKAFEIILKALHIILLLNLFFELSVFVFELVNTTSRIY